MCLSLNKRFISVFRFWWQIWSHENDPSALRVPGGHSGCQTFRTCWWTVSSRGPQSRRAGDRQLWGNVVQTKREVVVYSQSQDEGSVWQVPRRTRHNWTTSCPQSHHRPSTSVLRRYHQILLHAAFQSLPSEYNFVTQHLSYNLKRVIT